MSLNVTLTAWAASQFDPPPAERTIRLWVREGRIVPAPLKIGRTYYVVAVRRDGPARDRGDRRGACALSVGGFHTAGVTVRW